MQEKDLKQIEKLFEKGFAEGFKQAFERIWEDNLEPALDVLERGQEEIKLKLDKCCLSF